VNIQTKEKERIVSCDTRLKPKQTIQQRAAEVRSAVARLSVALTQGRVTAKVGPQGAIAFVGWADAERDGVSDACAYRRLLVEGSALAKTAIARAEELAGRTVDKQALAQGWHTHDGTNWNRHKH
jgi:hypothetical protein